MWIERPGLGTGVPKHPTLPPNGAAVLTDVKKPLLLAACPPNPSFQPRLPMCGSGSILSPDTNYCQTFCAASQASTPWPEMVS